MKTMKYIYTLLLGLLITGLSSCMEEKIGGGDQEVEGLRLSLSIAASDVISPLTKASATDANAINDLNILVYNKDDNSLVKDLYLTNSELKGLSVANDSEVNAIDYDVALQNGSYRVRVIANVGSLSNKSFDEIDRLSYAVTSTNLPQMVMSASSDNVSVSAGKGSAVLSLKRIYAMISVSVNTSGLKDRTIKPLKVSLHQVPATGKLFMNNLIPANPSSSDYITEADMIEFSDPVENVSSMKDNSVFFMYENKQPDGVCLLKDGKYVEAYKTPASLGNTPIKDVATVETDKTCSYIRVEAEYSEMGANGKIVYRFFLGDNAFTNFAVERNAHYNVTLNLTGKGGVDEASWRVTKDFNWDFTVDDIYIGYRVGSKSDIQVKLPTDHGWFDNCTWRVEGSNSKDFQIGAYDKNTNTIRVTTKKTNISSKDHITNTVTITATGKDGKSVSKTVTVNQVIRLVDPIAFYKKWDNTELVKVKVREFNKGKRKYEILNSIGPWTATIAAGDWFTLSTDDGQSVVGTSESVTGAGGDIVFYYKPNSTTKGAGYNRYGAIKVTYHNNRCEHMIYLRQGYEDTQLLDGGATWSLFNCSGDNKITEYPTQSGVFFQGSRGDIYYNPWKAVYGKPYQGWNGIPGSDMQPKPVGKYRGDWDNKQGVCPSGYVVASSADYIKIRTEAINETLFTYSGYVYDDSCPIEDTPYGWKWGLNGNAEIESNSNSNPAKGTLIVRKNGDPINIFFSYGKGVMTGHGNHPEDTGIDEIGVGVLNYGTGILQYPLDKTHRYGAQYWSGTPTPSYGDDKSSTNQYFIDMWYSLEQNTPLSVGNYNLNYGMLVRCVRSKK
ncbi:fimbrial protein [Parabacteroides distasonis]|uniref:fimbrial protein n=1 Tax=Parabacteroides distasonis TaxID=823 RepID=UPI0018971CE9|nr:fimbrial protein [Parabacteroides distasonis]MDB8996746.1 fimbrial protein [Parabacteroides distasonis]MDB9070291.1 fimbrial protein [Parabacteroides distasonis]